RDRSSYSRVLNDGERNESDMTFFQNESRLYTQRRDVFSCGDTENNGRFQLEFTIAIWVQHMEG
ncbi:hypothetical protein NPIL_130941, partial [Nephila pilipes]